MSPSEDENKEKFETLNRLLDEEYILVHVDTTVEEVTIPENLKIQPTVTLKLSRLFRGGIELSSDRILSNLLFNNNYFACVLPLKAIWGVTSEKGNNVMWPESAPKAIMNEILANGQKKKEEAPQQTKRPVLKRIK